MSMTESLLLFCGAALGWVMKRKPSGESEPLPHPPLSSVNTGPLYLTHSLTDSTKLEKENG